MFLQSKKLVLLITAILTCELVGCAAKYGTKRRGSPDGAQVPNDSKDSDGLPDESKSNGLGPTAGVEVVVDGQVVSRVSKGTKAIIRPTAETKDGDNDSKDGCLHPGIVEAHYEIASSKITATSEDGCDSLEVAYIFDESGSISIKLTVKSDEDESANASTNLSVVGESTAVPPPSFRIEANPLDVEVGANIAFTAFCEGQSDDPKIQWDFGDGQTSDTPLSKHSYAKPGTFRVVSRCRIDNQKLEAYLTVLIKPSSDGSGTGGSQTSGSGSGSGGDGGGDGSSTGDGGSSPSSGGKSTDGVPSEEENGSSTGSSQNPNQNPSQRPI